MKITKKEFFIQTAILLLRRIYIIQYIHVSSRLLWNIKIPLIRLKSTLVDWG